MADDTDAAEDERAIELSSIAAIYPELNIDPKNPYRATLELAVSPLRPLKIQFSQPSADGGIAALQAISTSITQQNGGDKTLPPMQPAVVDDEHELSHLPPLRLEISLPAEYPLAKSPDVALRVVPQWLPNSVLTKLQGDCERLWEEAGRDQVVYTFIDHLEQGAEHAFGLAENQGKGHGLQMSSDLKLALLDFELKKEREKFEAETFGCPICLEPKKGKDCHKILLCGHVFCVPCLQDCYNVSINEGDVDMVKCLTPDCGKNQISQRQTDGRPTKRRKQDRTLNPSELMQISIAQELVQRYVRLKRKKKIEADKNTIYCPRQWCQGPARSKKHPKPSDPMNGIDELSSESEVEEMPQPIDSSKKGKKGKKEDDIPMSERLAICEDCTFAFCIVCRKGWHGVASMCNPRRATELQAEEKASIDYLRRYSTPCPTCNAPCQKTMGCNHMICFSCKTHFCYLCSTYLMADNPYKHFNEPKKGCYMRLWELEAGDGDQDGRGLNADLGNPEWEPEESDSDSDSNDEEDDEDGEDFAEFGGDDDDDDDDEDTDDSEPAPDQRRRPATNMHIEIVNYAREGAAARRFDLPERPRNPQEIAAAAAPPARQQQQQQQQQGNGLRLLGNPRRHHRPNQVAMRRNDRREQSPPRPAPQPADAIPAAIPAPPDEAEAEDDPDYIQAEPAPGQGNGYAAQQPAPVRAMGLERFLQLAQQDQEDEWDSDELDDGDELDDIDEPAPHHHGYGRPTWMPYVYRRP